MHCQKMSPLTKSRRKNKNLFFTLKCTLNPILLKLIKSHQRISPNTPCLVIAQMPQPIYSHRKAYLSKQPLLQLLTLTYYTVGLRFKPRPSRHAARSCFLHPPFLPPLENILHLPHCPLIPPLRGRVICFSHVTQTFILQGLNFIPVCNNQNKLELLYLLHDLMRKMIVKCYKNHNKNKFCDPLHISNSGLDVNVGLQNQLQT